MVANTNTLAIEYDDAARLASQLTRTAGDLSDKAINAARKDIDLSSAMFERAQDMIKLAAFVGRGKLKYALNFYKKLSPETREEVPTRVKNLMAKVDFVVSQEADNERRAA